MGLRIKRGGKKSGPAKDDNSALKIRLRGKDDAALSMPELRDCLLEAARKLKLYEHSYRAKFATIYLTMIDEDGNAVRINAGNELVIRPYLTAADERGV